MLHRLFLLPLIGSVLLLSAVPARACKQPSDEWLFARASAVFLARVVRTDEAWGVTPLGGEPEVIVEGTLRIIEVFKGQPPKDGKVKAAAAQPCGPVPLWTAMDYVFFLYDDHNFLLPNGGSVPLGKPFDGLFGGKKIVGEASCARGHSKVAPIVTTLADPRMQLDDQHPLAATVGRTVAVTAMSQRLFCARCEEWLC